MSPEVEAKIKRNLAEVVDEEKCNTIIYSGFTPFVGAGIDVGGWSFTLNIGKGKEKMGNSLEPKPFTIEELYSRVESDIKELHLDGVRIQDKIFINGQDIRGDSRFLPDPFRRPLTQLDISSIKEFITWLKLFNIQQTENETENEGIVFIWEKVINGVNSIFSLIMSLYLVEILNREILAEPPHNSY